MSGKNHNISKVVSFNNFFKFKSLWADLKDAIGGNDKDFTSIKLRKAIFLLSVPMVLEMVMESTFAIFDIYFVSKLGADAVYDIFW